MYAWSMYAWIMDHLSSGFDFRKDRSGDAPLRDCCVLAAALKWDRCPAATGGA
jgi:hypothetical protein